MKTMISSVKQETSQYGVSRQNCQLEILSMDSKQLEEMLELIKNEKDVTLLIGDFEHQLLKDLNEITIARMITDNIAAGNDQQVAFLREYVKRRENSKTMEIKP